MEPAVSLMVFSLFCNNFPIFSYVEIQRFQVPISHRAIPCFPLLHGSGRHLFRNKNRHGYRLPLITIISDSGWLPVITGYHNFGLSFVTGYHWLPEFWTQVGFRLPLVTIISDSDLFPVTTGYHNFGLRLVPGYHLLP